MTDKQRTYIRYLDSKCQIRGLKIKSTDNDLLGADWEKYYKNFTPDFTSEVIDKLHEALGMPKTEKPKGKRR